MKIKNILIVLSLLILVLLCVGCSFATQADDNLSIDDANVPLEADNTASDLKENTSSSSNPAQTNSTTQTADNQNANSNKKQENAPKKIKPNVLCDNGFVHKKSNTFKVKLWSYKESNKKFTYYKNVKLTVKVKIGKKTKVFNVKTNKKGEAKILNVKNLKVGTYKVTVTTPDKKYQIKEKGLIVIYGKAKKVTTVKLKKTKYGIESTKKLNKKDLLYVFYEPKDRQYDKGVYAETWDLKDPLGAYSHSMITKAKFTFKNKKTGKLITKTAKLTKDNFYGWKQIKVSPVKGYVPVKAKVWYLTR